MLAAKGVFAEDDQQRIHLTSAVTVLRSGVDGSLRDKLRLAWQDLIWATYGELPYTVMMGEPAFDRAHGSHLFDYLAGNPDADAAFDKAMAQISGPEDTAVAAAYDFGRHRLIVNVGGGRGGLLSAVLERYQRVRGVLFDQAQVVANADLIDGELQKRCSLAGGDFFHSVPPNADAYVLKRIVHDSDDDGAIDLLRRCRAAVRPDGRILVVEAVIRPETSRIRTRTRMSG